MKFYFVILSINKNHARVFKVHFTQHGFQLKLTLFNSCSFVLQTDISGFPIAQIGDSFEVISLFCA